MSKHPPGPSPPPWLGGEGTRIPAGRAAPAPRRRDERGSLRARLISCQQPFVWEEGSRGETKRQRARREGAGRPCHAEAARRRRREGWRCRPRFLSRGSEGLPRLTLPRVAGSGPKTCRRLVPGGISPAAAAPGGVVRARPLLAAPPLAGPNLPRPWRPSSSNPPQDTSGPPGGAAVKPLQARPPAPMGQLGRNS